MFRRFNFGPIIGWVIIMCDTLGSWFIPLVISNCVVVSRAWSHLSLFYCVLAAIRYYLIMPSVGFVNDANCVLEFKARHKFMSIFFRLLGVHFH